MDPFYETWQVPKLWTIHWWRYHSAFYLLHVQMQAHA